MALNNIEMKKIACAFVKRKALRDMIALIPVHRRHREEFRDCQNLPVKRAGILFGMMATVTDVDIYILFLLIRRRKQRRVQVRVLLEQDMSGRQKGTIVTGRPVPNVQGNGTLHLI